MLRGIVLIALLATACERDVRAIPLADDGPAIAEAPPGRAVFDLLRIDTDGARTDRGSQVTFTWPDRSITLRELGDARTAGRRADYTAQIALVDAEPLLCQLGDDHGTPELIGDVVLCDRAFEVRCRGGHAPEVGVSGFWCVQELATLAIDRDSIRGAACSSAGDVAQAPAALRETAQALSLARVVQVDDGAVELSTRRSCDVERGEELMLYATDGQARTVSVLAITPRDGRCDVRLRVEAMAVDRERALWLVGPPITARATPAPPPPPLPSLGGADWGRLRHEFDLDRDGAVDTIVRSGHGSEHLLILDVDAARWYLREPVVG
jgi:hypothetical protein